MAAKKLVNIHEAFEYLENLDVSSEDDLSDDWDSSEGEDWLFLPQNDEGDRDTDEDSGGENELLPNNLNRSQLSARALADLST